MPEKKNMSTESEPVQAVAGDAKYRSIAAYILMVFLVVFTSVGAGLIYLPAGFITLGVTSGLFGYLLGAD